MTVGRVYSTMSTAPVSWILEALLEQKEKQLEKLERERDEAREAFAIATSNCVNAQQRLREMEDQRDFAMSEMERLKQ